MRKRILVVDDQAELRKLLRLTLQMIDCELHEAVDGAAALALAAAQPPDVVILDVMLPGGIDGFQVCRRLKADPHTRGAYVLLLSARGQKSDLEAGREAGADAYMVKPFSPLELIKTISTLGA